MIPINHKEQEYIDLQEYLLKNHNKMMSLKIPRHRFQYLNK